MNSRLNDSTTYFLTSLVRFSINQNEEQLAALCLDITQLKEIETKIVSNKSIDNAKLIKNLKSISDTGFRISKIVSAMKNLSRKENQLNITALKFGEILEAIELLALPRFQEANISLKSKYHLIKNPLANQKTNQTPPRTLLRSP